MRKKFLKMGVLIAMSTLTSCSSRKMVSSDNSPTITINVTEKDDDETEVKQEVNKDSTILEEKDYVPLKELKRNNKKYYYGDLKAAGYNHQHNDIYLKDGVKYQINKIDNYKMTYDISALKLINRRKVGDYYFASSRGDLTSDINESAFSYSLDEQYKEKWYSTYKESVVESSLKGYEFIDYKMNNSSFTKDVVSNMSFASDYVDFSLLDDYSFNRDGFTYKIAKFKRDNGIIDYKYVRFDSTMNVTSKFKTGYKVKTHKVKTDDQGKIAYVPILISYGQYNDGWDKNVPDHLDSSLCNECKSPFKRLLEADEFMFIKRSEYDELLSYSGKHNIRADNEFDFKDNYYKTVKVTPYNEFGSYKSRYQSAIYLPSSLSIPINGKRNMNDNEYFNAFSSVKEINATYLNYPIFFEDETSFYSESYKYTLPFNISLTKLRTHRVSYPDSIQLQRVEDGKKDTYTVNQTFENIKGLFLDENIEISNISSNNIDDLYSKRNVITSTSYYPSEEDTSLNKQGIYSYRSEVAKRNNIKVYEKYLEDIYRNKIDETQDDFVIVDNLGYYSFKYNRYIKENNKNTLDFYFKGNKKITKDDLGINNFELEIKDININDDNEYLYTIVKSV